MLDALLAQAFCPAPLLATTSSKKLNLPTAISTACRASVSTTFCPCMFATAAMLVLLNRTIDTANMVITISMISDTSRVMPRSRRAIGAGLAFTDSPCVR